MDKVLRIVPMALFCLFAVKSIIVAPSLSDGLSLAILASLVAFLEYKASESRLKVLNARQDELELKLKDLTTHHTELKSFVQALNMGTNFNKMTQRPKGL